jgi:hypothetical protein
MNWQFQREMAVACAGPPSKRTVRDDGRQVTRRTTIAAASAVSKPLKAPDEVIPLQNNEYVKSITRSMNAGPMARHHLMKRILTRVKSHGTKETFLIDSEDEFYDSSDDKRGDYCRQSRE